MLCQMKLAARSSRAMDAPMLYDLGPQSGGMGPLPAPCGPWHVMQSCVSYTTRPAVVSPTSVSFIEMMPSAPAIFVPTGTSCEMKYR